MNIVLSLHRILINTTMTLLKLPAGIASISGKVDNIVFYYRQGKQCARRLNRHSMQSDELSKQSRAFIEALSSH